MPELPEVQCVVDALRRKNIPGNRISGAAVYWPKSIANRTPEDFCKKIKGRTIRQITRRGKYIIFHLTGSMNMLIHLRMTGRLNLEPAHSPRNFHEHVVFDIGETATLRFQDTRKFGRIWLTGEPGRILDGLGPEPLEEGFTRGCFARMLQTVRRMIKPLLLDQRFIAGLGNIYVDEALWTAGIHPLRISSSLSLDEIDALHQAIPHVLRLGLQNLGTSLGTGKGNFYLPGDRPGSNADALNVFRRTGRACPRCRGVIVRIVVGQRSTHICPACQK